MTYARSRHLYPVVLATVLAGPLIPAAPCAAADCNNNGIDDAVDIITGISNDFDRDGTPDECQVIRYVDARATGRNDGTSWTDAFTDLQVALDAAAASNRRVIEIWVAAGVYRPDRGTGDRTASFELQSGLALLGGFAGNETKRSDRAGLFVETVLSGDLEGDDAPVTDPADLARDPTRTDNSETVVVGNLVDRFAVIDGFLITAGFNTDFNFTIGGGGMRITEGSPTIRNCTFAFNAAGRSGAGIDSRNSEPTLINCRFLGNSGSAMENAWSSTRIYNTVFSGNYSTFGGGAMENIISDVRLVNCTLAANRSRGVLNRNDSKLTLTNCIVWANPGRPFDGQPNTVVNYSCIEGGWTGAGGVGNIDVDPLFVRIPGQGTDPETIPDFGELRLRCDSPCVDAGDTASLPVEVTTDLDGGPRIRGSAVNMGAYEGSRQALIIDTTPLTVRENDVVSISIALACDPGEPIEVETVRVSGDPDIDVTSGRILRFDATNFATPQAITLAAADDLDLFAGVATIRASMPDAPSVFLTVTEDDNDLQSILFVDLASDGLDNGTSWADAFDDLQGALLVARQFPEIINEIWVAAGTYRPAPPRGDRAATFLLSNALRVYGGFDGSETSRVQRDPDAHTTILSGDLNGNDGPDFANTEENSYHVVTVDRLRIAPLLDGFIVCGGNAVDEEPGTQFSLNGFGGAIKAITSPLKLVNCLFIENQARNGAGLAWVNDCEPSLRLELERCRVSGNRSTSQRDRSQVFLGFCGTAEIRGCTFNGPLFIQNTRCNISDSDFGASISTADAFTLILRCRFRNARVGVRGSSTQLINCLFVVGASVWVSNGGSARITNCTMVGGTIGGTETSTFRVTNSIIWDPSDSFPSRGRPFEVRGWLNVAHSLIDGGWPGEGNLDADPMFVRNPGNGGGDDLGDLRLRQGSPVIDAGTNDVGFGGSPDDTAPLFDFDGGPRFLDDPDTPDSGMGTPPIVDIGAYEFALDGDFDFDFDIDLADFLAILACQDGRTVSVADDCRRADLDGDGDVDLADLIAFQARFTGSR